jgi:hypothetical protein
MTLPAFLAGGQIVRRVTVRLARLAAVRCSSQLLIGSIVQKTMEAEVATLDKLKQVLEA